MPRSRNALRKGLCSPSSQRALTGHREDSRSDPKRQAQAFQPAGYTPPHSSPVPALHALLLLLPWDCRRDLVPPHQLQHPTAHPLNCLNQPQTGFLPLSLKVNPFVFTPSSAISLFFATSRQAWELQLQNSCWTRDLQALAPKSSLELKELVKDRQTPAATRCCDHILQWLLCPHSCYFYILVFNSLSFSH